MASLSSQARHSRPTQVHVCVHLCAGSRPTALLRIGAYEARALDERRVERFTVCEREQTKPQLYSRL